MKTGGAESDLVCGRVAGYCGNDQKLSGSTKCKKLAGHS
jgi:hypothetical protein